METDMNNDGHWTEIVDTEHLFKAGESPENSAEITNIQEGGIIAMINTEYAEGGTEAVEAYLKKKQEAGEVPLYCFYPNGAVEFKTKEGFTLLNSEGVELISGARYSCNLIDDQNYSFVRDGQVHIFKDGAETIIDEPEEAYSLSQIAA